MQEASGPASAATKQAESNFHMAHQGTTWVKQFVPKAAKISTVAGQDMRCEVMRSRKKCDSARSLPVAPEAL